MFDGLGGMLVSSTQVYRVNWKHYGKRSELTDRCGGLNKNVPPQAHVLECLVTRE